MSLNSAKDKYLIYTTFTLKADPTLLAITILKIFKYNMTYTSPDDYKNENGNDQRYNYGNNDSLCDNVNNK
jgi:hypothetical protein